MDIMTDSYHHYVSEKTIEQWNCMCVCVWGGVVINSSLCQLYLYIESCISMIKQKHLEKHFKKKLSLQKLQIPIIKKSSSSCHILRVSSSGIYIRTCYYKLESICF